MKKMSKKVRRVAVEAGVGVMTAAALATAAAYLLSSKAQRRKAKTWAMKARREVAKNVKMARRMTGKEYTRVVDSAMKRYGSLHGVGSAELKRAAKDLKAEWARIERDAKVIAKRVQKATKRPARKAARARHRSRR